jgi:hypothetical protein
VVVVKGGYSIHIVTDDPTVFDALPAGRQWEATMVNWDTAEAWRKSGAPVERSALTDTDNVGMTITNPVERRERADFKYGPESDYEEPWKHPDYDPGMEQ